MKNEQLTKKEIAFRWQCSLRQVERDVKKFGLPPSGFIGRQLVWDVTGIQRLEDRRTRERLRRLNYG